MTQETGPTSRRFTLVEKEGYSIDLEYNQEFAILHLPKAKATKSILKDGLLAFEKIKRFTQDMGYADLWIATSDPIALKLTKRLGFEYQGSAEGLEVYKYEEEEAD